MHTVDFKELKRRVPIETVLDYLGVKLAGDEKQLRGPCPICKSTGQRSLAITRGVGLWHCFDKCGTGGDQLTFAAKFWQVSVKEAAEKLAAHFLTEKPAEKPQEATAAFQPLDYLVHDHEAVLAHFKPDDAKALGIGYAPKGIMRGCVVIPIRLPNGTLAGYVGLPDRMEIKVPKQWKI